MKALLTAALAATLISPALAETAPNPPAAPPQGDGAKADSDADPLKERQRNGAAKLAGLVRFVDASCSDAKPDYDRFKKVIASMGVDIKELETGTLLVRSLDYGKAYQKDSEESCKKALELFGENGTTVPGLIVPKTP